MYKQGCGPQLNFSLCAVGFLVGADIIAEAASTKEGPQNVTQLLQQRVPGPRARARFSAY
jgi:hypothetical protein